MKCVFLFSSIHQVMRGEKILKGKGMEVDLIPVPREISSDCGVAIEVSRGLREEALHLFEENNLSILGCYTKNQRGKFVSLIPPFSSCPPAEKHEAEG